jgi:hypothetical protein
MCGVSVLHWCTSSGVEGFHLCHVEIREDPDLCGRWTWSDNLWVLVKMPYRGIAHQYHIRNRKITMPSTGRLPYCTQFSSLFVRIKISEFGQNQIYSQGYVHTSWGPDIFCAGKLGCRGALPVLIVHRGLAVGPDHHSSVPTPPEMHEK